MQGNTREGSFNVEGTRTKASIVLKTPKCHRCDHWLNDVITGLTM
jgi:hypothetical protein